MPKPSLLWRHHFTHTGSDPTVCGAACISCSFFTHWNLDNQVFDRGIGKGDREWIQTHTPYIFSWIIDPQPISFDNKAMYALLWLSVLYVQFIYEIYRERERKVQGNLGVNSHVLMCLSPVIGGHVWKTERLFYILYNDGGGRRQDIPWQLWWWKTVQASSCLGRRGKGAFHQIIHSSWVG